jgi:hypothetical protein
MFNFLPNGRVEPKARLRFGNIEMGPGMQFGRGVEFSGTDLLEWAGKDLAVTQQDGVWIVDGYYN